MLAGIFPQAKMEMIQYKIVAKTVAKYDTEKKVYFQRVYPHLPNHSGSEYLFLYRGGLYGVVYAVLCAGGEV